MGLCRCWYALCCQSALLVKWRGYNLTPFSWHIRRPKEEQSAWNGLTWRDKILRCPWLSFSVRSHQISFSFFWFPATAGVQLFKRTYSNPAPVTITSKITYIACFSKNLSAGTVTELSKIKVRRFCREVRSLSGATSIHRFPLLFLPMHINFQEPHVLLVWKVTLSKGLFCCYLCCKKDVITIALH